MDNKIIAERLIALRGARTQQEIADEAGIAQSTYAMYELGQRRPTDTNKISLAAVFGKTVQEIFF
jgi:DNA-binding XRE family transcriptional regulator